MCLICSTANSSSERFAMMFSYTPSFIWKHNTQSHTVFGTAVCNKIKQGKPAYTTVLISPFQMQPLLFGVYPCKNDINLLVCLGEQASEGREGPSVDVLCPGSKTKAFSNA